MCADVIRHSTTAHVTPPTSSKQATSSAPQHTATPPQISTTSFPTPRHHFASAHAHSEPPSMASHSTSPKPSAYDLRPEMVFRINEPNVFRIDYAAPTYDKFPTFPYPLVTDPGVWKDDVLGPGFTYRTLVLPPTVDLNIITDTKNTAPTNNRNADTTIAAVKEHRFSSPQPSSIDAQLAAAATGDDDTTTSSTNFPYATIIRHTPSNDPGRIPHTPPTPHFVFLYLHGWNDYFFQRELPRHIALAGGAFYALELRDYGRSIRPHHEPCWTSDIRTYGADISAALQTIRQDHPHLPLLLCGHSTGGLTAALWAHAHQNQVAGLVLNSPWLELQTGTPSRYAFQAILAGLHRHPSLQVARKGQDNIYAQSLNGWKYSVDGALPQPLQPWSTDPSIAGWQTLDRWKDPSGRYVRAGWLAAILAGHERVAAGLNITCPVYLQSSMESFMTSTWDVQVLSKDAVLDADALTKRAACLGPDVTIKRLHSRHDVLLSFAPIRQEYFMGLHKWLHRRFPVPGNISSQRATQRAHMLAAQPGNGQRGPLTGSYQYIGNLPPSSYLAICP
ncbi:MAG: alpha/beta fold hydrolase [Actinomycetaceae bacterium]|nr:alpha/beta fold hydrolase [Actinomycetaceae bacterium]